jgi:hypothetical protein
MQISPTRSFPFAILAAATFLAACGNDSSSFPPLAPKFASGNLVLTRTVYSGVGTTITVGQQLPGGGTAVADGTFPNVFKNEVPDASFGVTSPVFLDQLTTAGAMVDTTPIDPTLVVSSFSSKSELALNVSTDGSSLTFVGYKTSINQLDVSNSNTPAVVDSTNPVKSSFSRAVTVVKLSSGAATIVPANSYSGNNGRAAILANGMLYLVGNSGNGNGDGASLSALSDNTGVQMIAATDTTSGTTSVVGAAQGTFGSSTGYQRGFSLSQLPDPAKPGQNYAADKTGKDDNFRGLTIFGNTLYVSKGSGSNGVNSVYQVGAAGALANGANLSGTSPITILPGFNTLSEKVAEAQATLTATPHPFGIWFADANTVYIADEGDGVRLGVAGKVTTFAGLQQWKLSSGTWKNTAIFQSGLLTQATYTAGLPWNVKTDGLRNISGHVNSDGSVTIFATTSTVSDETTHDLGADPNELVSINIGSSSTPANTSFTVLQTAKSGERYGGVAYLP